MVSLFSSCASMIPHKQNALGGLVLIVCNSTIKNSDNISVSYDIIYDKDKILRLDPTIKFSIYEEFSEGIHTISAIRTINQLSSDTTEEIKVNMDFHVEKGKVTILPIKFVTSGSVSGDRLFLYVNYLGISEKDIKEAKDFFNQQRNSSEWSFLEPK
jgi:hypothetical protein